MALEIKLQMEHCMPVPGADPGFWKGGAWGVGDKLAVRLSQVCAPGGLKACPLGTFEILHAFSCNLVHILSKNYI